MSPPPLKVTDPATNQGSSTTSPSRTLRYSVGIPRRADNDGWLATRARCNGPRKVRRPHSRGRVLVARVAVAVVVLLAVFAAGLPVGVAEGAGPVPPSVQATLRQVQSKPLYENSFWGLRVTGEVLIGELSDRLFVPGSIMKTFT